jgi:hypothetical protein
MADVHGLGLVTEREAQQRAALIVATLLGVVQSAAQFLPLVGVHFSSFSWVISFLLAMSVNVGRRISDFGVGVGLSYKD